MSKVAKSFHELGAEQYPNEWPGSDAIVADIDRAYVSGMGGVLGGLAKALATTSITGFGDANPLLLENLDDQMTSVLFDEKQLVMWNLFERVVSRQPYYEYNERLRYGGGRRAPGFSEGGVPKNATGAWQRLGEYVKFLGVRRGISHQALITGGLGGSQVNLAEEEERDGTLDLLALIERWFMFGNEDIKQAGGSNVNYDGIVQQMEDYLTAGRIDSRNIVDKAGDPIILEDIEKGALTLQTVGKLQTTSKVEFVMHPKVAQGISMQMLPAQRIMVSSGPRPGEYTFGNPVRSYVTNQGEVPFSPSIFMNEVEDDAPLLAAGDVEPTAPAAPSAPSGATSADVGADWAGTYYYGASAISDGGESLAIPTAAGVVVAADEKVTLTIPRVSAAYGYRIYRAPDGESDLTNAKIIATIAQPAAGDASFVDQNQRIPGTHYSLMFHNDRKDIVCAQMAPLIKFPLGLVNTTIEFLLLLYHVLVLKAPERCILYKNVGDYSVPA